MMLAAETTGYVPISVVLGYDLAGNYKMASDRLRVPERVDIAGIDIRGSGGKFLDDFCVGPGDTGVHRHLAP